MHDLWVLCQKPVTEHLSPIIHASSNRVTGVYELSLCHLADAGSPGDNLRAICATFLLASGATSRASPAASLPQACRGGAGGSSTHLWPTSAGRRTWPAGGLAATASSWTISGSWRSSVCCRRLLLFALALHSVYCNVGVCRCRGIYRGEANN